MAKRNGSDAHCFVAQASHEKPGIHVLIEVPDIPPARVCVSVGHRASNTAMDIIARKRRMEANNVLFPTQLMLSPA